MSCNMWSQTWRSPIVSSILNISSCKLTWMSGTKHHLQSILLRTPSLLHVYVGWPQGNLQGFQAPPTCSTSWPLLPALCSVWHHSRWAGRVPRAQCKSQRWPYPCSPGTRTRMGWISTKTGAFHRDWVGLNRLNQQWIVFTSSSASSKISRVWRRLALHGDIVGYKQQLWVQ